MKKNDIREQLHKIKGHYCSMAEEELRTRVEQLHPDLSKAEIYDATGGLLARQTTLAVHAVANPGTWNPQLAPCILRSMVDAHISLAWILCDPLDRSRKYIEYGLGQEKLHIEHLRSRSDNPDDDPQITSLLRWLNSQRYEFLTEVNVGSWSGIDTRKMAEDAGCIEMYRMAYQPLSSVAHNMWNHVGKYNLSFCPNPLHKFHKIPVVRRVDTIPEYARMAAWYAEESFQLFDKAMATKGLSPSAFQVFDTGLYELLDRVDAETKEE